MAKGNRPLELSSRCPLNNQGREDGDKREGKVEMVAYPESRLGALVFPKIGRLPSNIESSPLDLAKLIPHVQGR